MVTVIERVNNPNFAGGGIGRELQEGTMNNDESGMELQRGPIMVWSSEFNFEVRKGNCG
jgi:hypothetical protein